MNFYLWEITEIELNTSIAILVYIRIHYICAPQQSCMDTERINYATTPRCTVNITSIVIVIVEFHSPHIG